MINDNRIQENTEKKEKDALKILEGYVKDYKIFIDTCSLLYFASDKFWNNITPLLQRYENKIIIPLRIIEELEKHSNQTEKLELSRKARNRLKVIQYLLSHGYIEIRGEKTDNFADNVFQVVFTKFRMTHKLLLITQDNDLAKDILALNGSKSVRANQVNVKRINKYGFLSNLKRNINEDEHEKSTLSYTNMQNENTDIDEEEIFKICTAVTNIEDTPMKVSYIPKEQETVYTPQRSIKLLEEVAAGGEGIIYNTDTSYVAKIYKKENNTKRKYEKIKLILSKPIKCEGICFPVEALYNSNKEFIGYLMPKAKGKELQKSIFIKPLFIKNFPNWKKRDTVELCVTILKKIKYLHDRNIIMGDINPANILVVSPKEVYFVDTDSYQIENFPCPVGTNNYTAPEIQRKHFSSFLRSIGNENFAVATLLFMIMLPGKPPYSQQGGEDPIANIINMDFSYPLGESSNKKTPDGPWRYIWSHLTYDMKRAFYNTFRKDGSNSTEETRLSVNEWISIFSYFLELLDSGKYGKQDEMSEELFPTRHKRNSNVEYTTCKICGNEVAENQCHNGICRDCLSKGEVYKCKRCGKEIIFTNYQKYIKNSKKHDICSECFEYGNQVKMTQNCVDCGNHFRITNNQYEYFVNNGLSIPKRCSSCRKAKRNNIYTNTSSSSSYNCSSNSSSESGSFCFITTAVCDYFGKADDCEELELLRNYRDKWLRNQTDGPLLIAKYYNKAPLLVSLLTTSEKYSEYCEMLLIEYIQPCIQLIKDGSFEECKKLYQKMVEVLENKLIIKGKNNG